MIVPPRRLLAGADDAPHRLEERLLGTEPTVVEPVHTPGHAFVILIGCTGEATRVDGPRASWQMRSGEVSCAAHLGPLRFRVAAGGSSVILVWRFDTSVLSLGLSRLLIPFAACPRPFTGPRALDAAEHAIVQCLRSCPVAPNLRPFWANAKLSELVTHLLPSSASSSTRFGSASEGDTPPALPDQIRRALELMQARYDEPLRLGDLARAAGMSPSHFSRIFSQVVGRGPTEHLRRIRLETAARLLATGAANVTEASLLCGYGSLAQFSRAFQAFHGRPPSAFLQRRS